MSNSLAALAAARSALREADRDLLASRGRVGTARKLTANVETIDRFTAGSLRDCIIEAECLGDQVARTLRRVEFALNAVVGDDLPKPLPVAKADPLVELLLDQTEVQYRRAYQSARYGSSRVSFDASEAEVVTRSVVIDVESDDRIPVDVTADYRIDRETTVEVRFRLRSVQPNRSSMLCTYAVALADDAVPSDCHPTLPVAVC